MAEQGPVNREMIVGLNEEKFFIGFSPPVSGDQWRKFTNGKCFYEEQVSGDGTMQMYTLQRDIFPAFGTNWSREERLAFFLTKCRKMEGWLGGTEIYDEVILMQSTEDIEHLFTGSYVPAKHIWDKKPAGQQ